MIYFLSSLSSFIVVLCCVNCAVQAVEAEAATTAAMERERAEIGRHFSNIMEDVKACDMFLTS